mmetsp:Transcript_112966/g.364716  ORF Transcript_112966/g.364716 Transcript_112966/m.364716 type:complete len:883 (-) Transcript_112966:346-2994(-)
MDFSLIPVSRDSLEWQCSILKLGGVTVLLNCGWTESLDPKLLAPLIPHLPDLDLIVLTHADLKHLGAVPYLLTKYSIACPVICTEPVCRIGELSCVACLEDREKYRAPMDDFEVDDVLRIFMSRVRPMNYRETFTVHSRGRTLAASPYPAGAHLGSAYWTLQCGGHSVAYVVDCDMRRGRYLDGLDLQRLLPSCRGAAQRWDVVITSPLPSAALALPQRGVLQAPQSVSVASKAMKVAKNVREQLLLEETIATLRRGGSVLIPADVAGWIPEILLLLEAAWSQDRQLSTNYPLVWLSSMGDMVLDQVKTRLEYMSKQVLAMFETRFGQNPFVLKTVRIFQTLEELCAAHPLSRPKVILATSPYLEGGDSRELLMRLSAEPRNLLWLLGVPPTGTLARTLLDDFVLSHHSRKEYRLQQHLKQALPDEQLRVYYEAKLQELSDSGQKLPFLPAELVQPKAEDMVPPKPEDAHEPAVDTNAKRKDVGSVKLEPLAAPMLRTAAKQQKAIAGTLWSPLGWSTSRTLAHSEWRSEGDEYGHLLSAAELKAWRAQDQEGNKYSTGGAGFGGAAADHVDGDQVKEETTKVEDEGPPSGLDGVAEWRDSLRVHFREPMHCEVRERTVRVACRVHFLPDSTLEPKDLYTMMSLIAPKHLVLLPAASDVATGPIIEKTLQCSRLVDGAAAPEIHVLQSEDPSLQFPLRGVKRKAQFLPEAWPALRFLRAAEGVRVACARVAPGQPPDGLEPRVLELGSCGAADDVASAGGRPARLPRSASLLVGMGQEPLSLSSLKEQLRGTEWAGDTVDIEFQEPGPHVARSWSARVLMSGGRATLGWAGGGQQSGGEGGRRRSDASSTGRRSNTVLRLEGMPSEEFFMARAAIYRRSALV